MKIESLARRVRHGLAPLATALAASLVVACGSGDQLARTGGGGTGIASVGGTVTGFGSVVVDSDRWDDRRARVEIERSPGAGQVLAETKLGQRVLIESTTAGVADRIELDPEVIGRVTETSPTAVPPQFKVAGQTVLVNVDPAVGPVTVFDGASGVAALLAGDAVEVHGSQRFDAALNRYVVLASRVERLATLPANLVRVAGTVSALSAVDRRFVLGELTVTALSSTVQVPANRTLANGQRVVVWSDDPFGSGSGGPTLTADFIRIVERSTGGGGRSQLSGNVSRLDPNALTFEAAGMRVNARAAIIVPASQTLTDGRYVIVNGEFDNAGVLQARQVRIRRGDASDSAITLEGSITDFQSIASFRVRGVGVDATGVSPLSACPASGLANGLFVEISGRINVADGRVIGERLRCVPDPSGRVLTLEGAAGNVNASAQSFTLTPGTGGAWVVAWTANTYFEGVTAATLAGRTVSVEGFADGANFIALKIKLRG
jgi:hypothetical protein